ncbi:guanylate cyclase [Plakobranchus ocellatus]|uniref:Guanylate cyclase n=1 Tax=Plakobranchus ocellatus TaxID=259542 RepID=A0AAV4CQZ8_9GAST|nr:guanylate cyclase [Plakobranchus ocellatus]
MGTTGTLDSLPSPTASAATPTPPPKTTTATRTTTTATVSSETIKPTVEEDCFTAHRLRRPPKLIKLGVILPYTGNHPWVLPLALPAIQIALEEITNNTDLLKGYTVHIRTEDSNCSETMGPLAAVDMYFNQSADVFFGPACAYSVAPVARFSHFWGIPVLTAGGLVTALKDKTEYKLLTRVQGTHAKVSEVILQLLHNFEWTVLALVYNDAPRSPNSEKRTCYFSAEAVFHDYVKAYGQKPFFRDFDEQRPDVDFTHILVSASQRARGKERGDAGSSYFL